MIKEYEEGFCPMIREWLAAMLRGDDPHWMFPEALAYDTISDEANAEGVIALLHERINAANNETGIPVSFREHIAELARRKAQLSLMREAECRKILSHLQSAGIDVLLLKGSALAYWAYTSPHLRDCSDIDLLFSSHADTCKAITCLESLAYHLRDPVLAGDLVSFEHTCIRDSNSGTGLEIDLHWQLSSSPIFAYRFHFDELNRQAISLPKLGEFARGLSPVHAFFNACMHRIQNMAEGSENSLKWLYDLHLLGSGFSPGQWQQVIDIAIDRKLAGACRDGLLAAQQEFRTLLPEPILVLLLHAEKNELMKTGKMHRWFYIQYMSIMAFPNWRLRMRWLRQRLFPNRAYLKMRYGETSGIHLLLKRIKAGFQRLS